MKEEEWWEAVPAKRARYRFPADGNNSSLLAGLIRRMPLEKRRYNSRLRSVRKMEIPQRLMQGRSIQR